MNITLLDPTRTWEIQLVIPQLERPCRKALQDDRRGAAHVAFQLDTPIAEAIDVLKLFFTIDDVDFRWLVTTGVTRGTVCSPTSNALGQLLDSLDAPDNGPAMRASTLPVGAMGGARDAIPDVSLSASVARIRDRP